MTLLFPQISAPTAKKVISTPLGVEFKPFRGLVPPGLKVYWDSIGSRMREEDMRRCIDEIWRIAMDHGWPRLKEMPIAIEPKVTIQANRKESFDLALSRVVHGWRELGAHQASKMGVWRYMACVHLRDLIRWRYPGDSGIEIGEDGQSLSVPREERYLKPLRNPLSRAWIRAHILCDLEHVKDPLHLLALPEDTLVGITERSSIGARPRLAKAIARYVKAGELNTEASRRLLKKIRAHLPGFEPEAWDDGMMTAFLDKMRLSGG